jgi:hypothetical protein
LLHNREPSDISESEFTDDSDCNVDTSSASEQRQNYFDEDNVNDKSDMKMAAFWVVAPCRLV